VLCHPAGFDFFGPVLPDFPLPYHEEPPYVTTVLPTVGPMDCSLVDYLKNNFEVRCVACTPLYYEVPSVTGITEQRPRGRGFVSSPARHLAINSPSPPPTPPQRFVTGGCLNPNPETLNPEP
jgi:hypothetical protein